MDAFDFGGKIAWRPTPDVIAQSNLQRFMQTHGLRSLDELQQRSVTDLDWFWNAMLGDLDIRFRRPYSRVVDLSHGPAWPEWCVGGEMNIVDSCLDKYAGKATDSKTAIEWEGEEGRSRCLFYSELRREVNRMANALRALGLGNGDAIGVFMPMTPEIVVATAVDRKAPTRFSTADNPTATFGFSAPLAMEVAIALPVS